MTTIDNTTVAAVRSKAYELYGHIVRAAIVWNATGVSEPRRTELLNIARQVPTYLARPTANASHEYSLSSIADLQSEFARVSEEVQLETAACRYVPAFLDATLRSALCMVEYGTAFYEVRTALEERRRTAIKRILALRRDARLAGHVSADLVDEANCLCRDVTSLTAQIDQLNVMHDEIMFLRRQPDLLPSIGSDAAGP